MYAYKGPLNAIQTIAAKEGVKTLYKGYGTVAMTAPAQALYMGTYQSVKKLIPGTYLSTGFGELLFKLCLAHESLLLLSVPHACMC